MMVRAMAALVLAVAAVGLVAGRQEWCVWCKHHCPELWDNISDDEAVCSQPAIAEQPARYADDWHQRSWWRMVLDALYGEFWYFCYGICIAPVRGALWAVYTVICNRAIVLRTMLLRMYRVWWRWSRYAQNVRVCCRRTMRTQHTAIELLALAYQRCGERTLIQDGTLWVTAPPFGATAEVQVPTYTEADGMTWRVAAMGPRTTRAAIRTPSSDLVFDDAGAQVAAVEGPQEQAA